MLLYETYSVMRGYLCSDEKEREIERKKARHGVNTIKQKRLTQGFRIVLQVIYLMAKRLKQHICNCKIESEKEAATDFVHNVTHKFSQ